MPVLQYRKSKIEEFLKECTGWSCMQIICLLGYSGLVTFIFSTCSWFELCQIDVSLLLLFSFYF